MNKKFLLEPKFIEVDPEQYEEQYENFIDDIYGEVDVAGYRYDTSYVLKELDDIAYRCGLLDYVGLRLEEGYECPYCSTIYKNFDDAKYCCQEDDDEEE